MARVARDWLAIARAILARWRAAHGEIRIVRAPLAPCPGCMHTPCQCERRFTA